jgi:hypothetical protein
MFYVFYKTGISIFKNISLSKYLLIFSLLTIIFSSSFFKTGCFFYPINKTCFSHASISWSEKPRIKDYSTLVALWAKGFHHQDKTQYKRIEDRKIYNQNFNWIKYWIELHFFYKIFEFLLTVISLILLIYFYFKKEKKIFYEYNKDKIILCFLSFLSIIFWFITVPSFRFGFSSIIIFFYLLFNLILNLNINFDKKKFFNILVLSIIVLNLKNINRIKSEFERSDFYKFKNFPFYNEKIINNDYTNIKIEKVIHIDILKRY